MAPHAPSTRAPPPARAEGTEARQTPVDTYDPRLVPTFEKQAPSTSASPLPLALAALDTALSGHVSTLLLTGPGARELAREVDEVAAERGAHKVAATFTSESAWCDVAAGLDLPFPAPGTQPSQHALDAFARALRTRARGSGLVVTLHGVDRASPDELQLLELVGGLPVDARILLLCPLDEPEPSSDAEGEAGARLGRLVRTTGARVLNAP